MCHPDADHSRRPSPQSRSHAQGHGEGRAAHIEDKHAAHPRPPRQVREEGAWAKRVPEVDSSRRLLIVPLFRGSSRFDRDVQHTLKTSTQPIRDLRDKYGNKVLSTPNPQPSAPNTQHPPPTTQHPTPNTQHPTPNTQPHPSTPKGAFGGRWRRGGVCGRTRRAQHCDGSCEGGVCWRVCVPRRCRPGVGRARPFAGGGRQGQGLPFFFITLSRLELRDAKVYEPYMRALLGTASHFCKVLILN